MRECVKKTFVRLIEEYKLIEFPQYNEMYFDKISDKNWISTLALSINLVLFLSLDTTLVLLKPN